MVIALAVGNSMTRPLSLPVTAKLPGPPAVPVTAVETAASYEFESDGVIVAVIE